MPTAREGDVTVTHFCRALVHDEPQLECALKLRSQAGTKEVNNGNVFISDIFAVCRVYCGKTRFLGEQL